MRKQPEPYEFEDTKTWFHKINTEWQMKPPADLHCSVTPNEVEAASGHTFVFTLKVGNDLTIPRGGHITLEVHHTWGVDKGNTYRKLVKNVAARSQTGNMYCALAEAECSNRNVALACRASWGPFLDLLDIVVADGAIEPGDSVTVALGTEESCPSQAQKFSQVAISPVGVDVNGDKDYRRAAVHPTIKVVGAFADRLRVFAPAVVRPGRLFSFRVLPVDYYSFNPATRYASTVRLTGSGGLAVPDAVDIDSSAHPFGVEAQAGPMDTGGPCHIVAFDQHNAISGKSNPVITEYPQDLNVYFGELHSQMWRSMGSGTTEEYFTWGRDIAGLDFCAPANHYGVRFQVTDEILQEVIDTTNRFHEPGRFATLNSYEYRAASGHKNIYFRGAASDSFLDVNTRPADEMWAHFKERDDIITIPHHTKASRKQDGVNTQWDFRNDKFQRVAEICSQWGISESGSPTSIQAGLAMGHRIGFVGGTDSHYGCANQGHYHVNDGNALACIIAPELTREALWQALHDRRCYATTGDRIILDFTMDGHLMGTDLAVDLSSHGPRNFSIRVFGTYRIDSVEIIRNNEVLFSEEPAQDSWEGEWGFLPTPSKRYIPRIVGILAHPLEEVE